MIGLFVDELEARADLLPPGVSYVQPKYAIPGAMGRL
jgi:hypothetical protein